MRNSEASPSRPLSGQYNERVQPVGPKPACQRPPWFRFIAVNARTGQVVWESELGVNDLLAEEKRLVDAKTGKEI